MYDNEEFNDMYDLNIGGHIYYMYIIILHRDKDLSSIKTLNIYILFLCKKTQM